MKKYSLKNVIFEITRDCNLDCVYCYNHWKAQPDGLKYPGKNQYSLAKKALKRLFKLSEVRRLSFSGGEPFLSEKLHELALFCRMKGKEVNIITNGNAAKRGDYLLFKNIGISLFELPLHSFDLAVHDLMSGKQGAWDRSVNSIQELMSMEMPAAVVIVLTRFNMNGIEKTLRFIRELGVRNVLVNRYNIGGKCIGNWNEIALSPVELNHVFREIDRVAPEIGLKVSSGVCTPVCLVDPQEYPNISFGHCGNTPENMPIALDILGNVRFCNHSPMVIGNIFENNFDEIFNSFEAIKWLKTVPEGCQGCKLLSVCKGGCRAAAEQVYGTVSQPDPYLKWTK